MHPFSAQVEVARQRARLKRSGGRPGRARRADPVLTEIVRNGVVAAREIYRVEFAADGSVDREATRRLRAPAA
jgi:hypothetical protein